MTAGRANRGGATVGYLDELDDVELSAVVYMRHWCASAEDQATVWNDFAGVFGAREGKRQLAAFETLIETLITHGRRPIMRHGIGCRCLGADECVLANLVGAAGQGDREEAALMAALLVRPGMATTVAAMAEEVGVVLRRMTLRSQRHVANTDTAATHTASLLRH